MADKVEHVHVTEPTFSVKIERNSRGYNFELTAHNATDLAAAYKQLKAQSAVIEREYNIPKVGAGS